MSKYLFLDVDGVLNHEDWYENMYKHGEPKPFPLSSFDPDCVRRVNEILDATGAELVISSSWRLDNTLYDTLSMVGLNRKFTCTPVFKYDNGYVEQYDNRGQEIEAYLSKKSDVESYCILDDDNDMLDSQRGNFVRTSAGYAENNPIYIDNGGGGLTEKVKEKVIKILNVQ